MKNYLFTFGVGLFVGIAAINSYQSFINPNPLPVALSPDGGIYRGELKNGIFEGQGRLVWNNDDHYEGTFKDGLFHGQGKIKTLNGFEYEGEFAKGRLTGFGTIIYQEGDTYTGEFVDGRQEGEGTYKFANMTYKGMFKNNKLNGKGSFEDEWKNRYQGDFVDGEFSGSGTYTSNDGRVYEGHYEAGQIISGTYKNSDGTEYNGEFLDWNYHGFGKLKAKQGAYVGSFDYGMFRGKGHLTLPNGDIYDGDFNYGLYDGNGTLTFSQPIDGVKQKSGTWRNGRLLDPATGQVEKDPAINNEVALYNQSKLLEQKFQTIAANDPNQIELYFLGVSGDGSQSVFRREVEYIEKKFAAQFSTEGKSISLINSRDTVHGSPLATSTSIALALNNIEQKMDVDNDVLFLYITSHGSKKFDITLNQERMSLPNLSAKRFADLLNQSKIKWKILVVSACYSGGLIPYLQNNTTMIITSASADRTSFGCKESAEFTYFGEAFFKHAIDQSNSFVDAFGKAVKLVADKEKLANYQPSMPRIHKPDPILNHLKKWRSELLEQKSNE